jgi:uncharacterized protein (UPF0335 family)
VHTVTKVLVVFAAVLCVVLAALTMAYAVNADRIVGNFLSERDARIAADTARAADAAQSKDWLQQKEEQLQAFSNKIAALESENRRLAGEKTDLISRIARAEAERDSIVQKIDQLAATNQTQAKVIENYSNEVTQLRENELRYRREAIQLADRISDLAGQNEIFQQSVRALQEQLAAANEALQAASTGVASTSGDSTPRAPIVPVNGRITKVEKSATTGDILAQINVGSNDQLRDNMRLFIVRGNDYLADLIVIKTDLKASVGRVVTYGRAVEVRPDDVVRSSLR